MDSADIHLAVQADAVWVAFLNVLLQQLGLPVPAVPTLLVIGSLAVPTTLLLVLAVAVAASVLADAAWYGAGRFFGYRVLSGLCRLSINPGSCITQTEARFVRWGIWSLIVAKFVPGFSTVAPPIAGALKMPLPGFLLASGIGAGLWAGLALTGGWLLRDELQAIVALASGNSTHVLVAVVLVVGGWIAWKWWQKYRFEQRAAIPRITIDELVEAMESPTPPLVLDLRSIVMQAELGLIPGAVPADRAKLGAAVGSWPKEAAIVTLCDCPADASAVDAARALMARGYTDVKPLQGGFAAWQQHGKLQ